MDPVLEKAVLVPNPVLGGQAKVSLKMRGAAQGFEARAYGKAWVQCMSQQVASPLRAGWNHGLSLDLSSLPSGTYYLKVRPLNGSPWVLLKMVVLR